MSNTTITKSNRGPYKEWDRQTPEEITNVFKQVRLVLIDNRVVFATSGKSINSCMHVLKKHPKAQTMLLQRREKRVGGSDNPNDENPEDDIDIFNLGVPPPPPSSNDLVIEVPDINNGEEKTEVVAVLDPAARLMEAEMFAKECAARVIGILLDQYSSRVELRYQDIISQTLLDAIELSSYMVSIQSEESVHRVYGKHCRLTFLFLLPCSNLFCCLCHVSPLF